MTLEEMLTAARSLAKQAYTDAEEERRKLDEAKEAAYRDKVELGGHYWQRLYRLRERSRSADLLVKALEAELPKA